MKRIKKKKRTNMHSKIQIQNLLDQSDSHTLEKFGCPVA